MNSRATFSFKNVKIEITSEDVKYWMSSRVEGPLEIDPSNREQAEALFDLLSDQLEPKTVSMLEQLGEKQFAALFEVYAEADSEA